MLNIVEAMDDPELFEPWFRGASWKGWRAILRGAYALPMTDEEVTFFHQVAEREPPTRRVRELWIPAGRRSGKDSVASLIVSHSAALFDMQDRLRPGERALCLCLATDRDQAKIVLNYTRAYFEENEHLMELVTHSTANGFELDNGVDIAIGTNNYRSVRGRPILCAVFDEVALWRDENSMSPDEETYRAIVPGMATMPGAMLIGISSPYRKSGLLWKKYREHFGKDGDILVVKAPSLTLNPTLDPNIISTALEEDPAAARAEWLAEFRDDISSFLTYELIDAAIDRGVSARPPQERFQYVGFVDAASGVGKDSFAIAIAHAEAELAVLDVAHEIRPPFNPQSAIEESAKLIRSYGITSVVGDRYAPGFVAEAFSRNGLIYEYSEKNRSDIYIETMPLFSSGRVRLVDNRRLETQFGTLQRRTGPTGRDRVDHGPSSESHDDLCNAAAGALTLVRTNRLSMFDVL